MKKKSRKIHTALDIFSSALFLYCCSVLLLLCVTGFMDNETIRIIFSVSVPFLVCRKINIIAFNGYIHDNCGLDW